ncbi:MAG: lytic polysaccharide monooxygenase [Vicinamibacterales bacterium]|nr:lytic polysaccharide monooxygenase [Vicinamibacterales bacterium]
MRFFSALVALVVAVPVVGDAHFKLLEPASWIVSNDRGDPQKAGPCGGDAKDPGTPTNVVGKAVGGQMLRLKVQETVYHPGHYRVALAVNSRDELPADPVTTTRETEKGPQSIWAVIQSPPQKPVLVDGLFQHYTRPAQPQIYEADVQLPNVSCRKCTLQIVQWMAQHGYNNPGGYTYHHCADVQITADPSKPLDTGWPESR